LSRLSRSTGPPVDKTRSSRSSSNCNIRKTFS
jgi:hypothetical protein